MCWIFFSTFWCLFRLCVLSGCFRGTFLRLRLLSCSIKIEFLKLSDLVWFFDNNSDRSSNGNSISIGIDFSDISFFLNFEGHGCFISLYLSYWISRRYFISFFNIPFKNFAFSHSRRKSWHLFQDRNTVRTSCLGKAKDQARPRVSLGNLLREDDANLNIIKSYLIIINLYLFRIKKGRSTYFCYQSTSNIVIRNIQDIY